MRRIEIITSREIPQAKVSYFSERGVELSPVIASWLSAFTAMAVAREVDKLSADEVVVTRLKDAFAAISARKLAKRQFRIIYDVAPNSDVPRGIPAEVRQQIDTWLFRSERLRDAYPADLRGVEVVDPVFYDDTLSSLPLPHPTESRRILWFGPIDGNVERLKQAIDHVGNGEADDTLRILGTGRARYAMEAVRRSRGVAHPHRIVWLGDEGNLIDEVTNATHIAQAGLDPTADELALAATGRPLIKYEIRNTKYEP